ncbi:glycosyltransferase family 2 protein [Chloroflexota bacterium]
MKTGDDLLGQTDLQIPVDDADAALRFCRSLAQLIDGNGDASNVLGLSLDRETTATKPPPQLSVVLPIYNEAENIPSLYSRLTDVLKAQGDSYELVFVDDGSVDGSLALLRDLARDDREMTIVELARNFGHQVAISAGLDFARGDGVIVMDADLQDPPEVLPEFIAKWREGYDVVYAIRARRKEHLPKRMCYAAFYRLLRRVTNVNIPLDAGDFCLMDRRVVDLLRSMPERNRFVRGIRSWVGLNQTGIAYKRDARFAGRPKYTIGRLTLLALDGFISFSYTPLRAASLLGFTISLLSLVLAAYYFAKKFFANLNPPGFATLVVAVFFLAGIQLITIGVIGEYVGRIFDEVKRRPLYVLRRVSGGGS